MAKVVPSASGVDSPASQAASTIGDEAVAEVTPRTLRRRGIISQLWKGLFGADDNIEKFLQKLSKEEAAVRSRLKRRTISSQRTSRHVIAISVVLEVLAVAYAIMTTREIDLNWQLKAARLLPMFLLPGLSAIIYSSLASLTRLFDRKDQKTLERLRAERQAKIDELKERTNYYSTQQIIQKYDLDPAAKAAAATVLASKLGVESGLKVYLGDEPETNTQLCRNYDSDQQTGLRNRKPANANDCSPGSSPLARFPDESINEYNSDVMERHSPKQRLTESSSAHNTGGWIARLAALIVGEDPTQCYALICRNCYIHNGLCRKEDLPYLTYYCPHCHALNGPRHSEESESSSISGNYALTSMMDGGGGISIEDDSTAIPTITDLGTGLPSPHEQPGEDEKEIHEVAT